MPKRNEESGDVGPAAQRRLWSGGSWFRHRSPHWRRWLAIFAVASSSTTLLAAWWWSPPAGLDAWRSGPPPRPWSTWIEQEARWQAEGIAAEVEFRYRPIEEIAIELQLAVLVGEDINFFGHQGVDWTAVREAVSEWWAGERLRGASTITQQLARNLFLSRERSWFRKLREARMAWWLERSLSKRRILELYLNIVEFGDGVLGAEAAARHYFATTAGRLTTNEAAGLAATLPAPRASNPETASVAWRNRRAVILERMEQVEWLRRRLSSAAGSGSGSIARPPTEPDGARSGAAGPNASRLRA